MWCPECGKQINGVEEICGNCGFKINLAEYTVSNIELQPEKSVNEVVLASEESKINAEPTKIEKSVTITNQVHDNEKEDNHGYISTEEKPKENVNAQKPIVETPKDLATDLTHELREDKGEETPKRKWIIISVVSIVVIVLLAIIVGITKKNSSEKEPSDDKTYQAKQENQAYNNSEKEITQPIADTTVNNSTQESISNEVVGTTDEQLNMSDTEARTVLNDIVAKNNLLNLVNEGDTEYLAFGTYYMEHCSETGSRTKDEIKKPLLWEVLQLSEDGNHALLLCKNIISFQPFDNNSYGTSWDTCTLRTWLNNEFYNVAFDSDERKLIEGSTITTPIFGTLESIETTDKIFVLSMEEAATLLGNGDVSSLDMIADWRVRTTYGDADDAYGWWLRSPTCDEGATYIGNNGRMTDYFINEMYDSMGVCPALWISLCDDVTDISPTSDVVISEYINIYKPKQKLTENRIELIRENAVAAGISEFPGGRSLEQMLINEIYAMKGYIFNDKELYEYFMNKSWYIPTTNDMDIISDSLTETEKKNVEFLKARRTVKINDIKSISATSALKEKSVTHKAEYISDDDLTTCWCEGKTGLGIGECVVWKFSAAQNIAGFTIYNGYLKSEGHYKKNAIPNMIAFEFYNKNGEFVGREEFTLADSMFEEAIKGTYYKFNKANDVYSVMMEILGANNGSKYEDTCISELIFWGYY